MAPQADRLHEPVLPKPRSAVRVIRRCRDLPDGGLLRPSGACSGRFVVPADAGRLDGAGRLVYECPMTIVKATFLFRIDEGSGVPPYQQLVRQVRQALRLGWLGVGDRLPTVRDVVAQLAINPNTVSKAYRELEYAGLVAGRPGQGTFVTATLADQSLKSHAGLRSQLERWFAAAAAAGLDDESIVALFETTRQSLRPRELV